MIVRVAPDVPNTLIEVRLHDAPVAFGPIDPYPVEAGGECVFLGRTRRETHPDHGALVRLSYHAYESMARRTLVELAETTARRFRCHVVRIHHALGEVPPGGASVMIQVACAHRAEAFDACRSIIDQLKRTAPIWKQERWADGTTWSEGVPAGPPADEGAMST